MPELPEVETVRRGLEELTIGKAIESVDYDWPKSFPNSKADVRQFLIGSKIVSVSRRAKVLMIGLSTEYSLVIHLKMTGQLVFRTKDNIKRFGAGHPSRSLVDELPDRSTRVTIDLGDSRLFFNDQRKFGWMKLVPTVKIFEMDFFKKVGPEPLDDNFTFDVFLSRLARKKNSNIKATLLDQTVIAGVGNIYADESLFSSGIHPTWRVGQISDESIKKLYTEIRKILKASIKAGGSSDRNYIDAKGNRGSYLSSAMVFRREGQPCKKCGTIIEKSKVAGRGTHICPICQPIKT